MASKQPRRSDLTSDLKFMAQTTYATMLFGLFWPLLDHFDRKKKERRRRTHLPLLDLSASPQVKRLPLWPLRNYPQSCILTRRKLRTRTYVAGEEEEGSPNPRQRHLPRPPRPLAHRCSTNIVHISLPPSLSVCLPFSLSVRLLQGRFKKPLIRSRMGSGAGTGVVQRDGAENISHPKVPAKKGSR